MQKRTTSADWEAAQMGFSAFDELPPLFSDYVIARVAAEVANATETSIWSGSAGEGNFDGLEALATADGDVVDVVGTTVTAANVVAELSKIVDAIPSGVYGKEDLTIYISQHIAKQYIAAQAALGYRELYNVGQTEMNFQGIKLFATGGLATNSAIAAQASNLILWYRSY